jgi:hypothetical protein
VASELGTRNVTGENPVFLRVLCLSSASCRVSLL